MLPPAPHSLDRENERTTNKRASHEASAQSCSAHFFGVSFADVHRCHRRWQLFCQPQSGLDIHWTQGRPSPRAKNALSGGSRPVFFGVEAPRRCRVSVSSLAPPLGHSNGCQTAQPTLWSGGGQNLAHLYSHFLTVLGLWLWLQVSDAPTNGTDARRRPATGRFLWKMHAQGVKYNLCNVVSVGGQHIHAGPCPI